MTTNQPFSAVSSAALIDQIRGRLTSYASDIGEDPQANSVKRLAFDLSDAMVKGSLDQASLQAVVRALAEEALDDRAARLADYHGADAHTKLTQYLTLKAAEGFDAFKETVETQISGIVFTAHPTFALAEHHRKRLVQRALGGSLIADNSPHLPDPNTELVDEHEQMIAAILAGQQVLRQLNAQILNIAKTNFGERWQEMRPGLITIATWVGYDLDGRTDIHWSRSITFKLEEKLLQLQAYCRQLEALALPDTTLLHDLQSAADLTAKQLEAFSVDLTQPENLSKAANLLTDPAAGRLISLVDSMDRLNALLPTLSADQAKNAILLLSDMKMFGLGVARVHFRVNAAQVRGAIRADLNVEEEAADFGRLALSVAAKRAQETGIVRVNFASVFSEQMTARRQFMVCAQILKHIDADTPIRFLIAECERPATVMGALYLAKLYGIADKMDISPLFETPEALERGGRFMEQLLDEPVYVEAIQKRGRLAIQMGYSDSGRFMGQIGAELSAERLQILLAKAIAARKLSGFSVILFNTHGESMGRGAHPSSFQERLDHLFTPWARNRYDHEAIPVIHETSFQGGDGLLHFMEPQLAESTLAHVALHALDLPERDSADAFYNQISFSWDIYRGLKSWHEGLFANRDYRQSLANLATQFRVKTGSRKSKRTAANDDDLSKVRAIPNNAALQQIAIPVNVFGGLGTVVRKEQDRFLDMAKNSGRIASILRYIAKARALTSLPAFRAYAGLYDAGFWVSRAARAQGGLKSAMLDLAQHLADQHHHLSLSRLANHVGADLIYLDAMLDKTEAGMAQADRHEKRVPIHILHAVRVALLMQAFVLIAQLPSFSRRHDVSRSDLVDMVLRLQLNDATQVLDRVFPEGAAAALEQISLHEAADEMDGLDHGYPKVHAEVIKPLKQMIGLLEETCVGLSHYYGAWG